MIHSVVIIQPPLVQLNGPYPSGAYLASFFRTLASLPESGINDVRWIDVNNRFFRTLFSASGLSRLFGLARDSVLSGKAGAGASGSPDAETGWQLRRYLSMEERWVSWVGGIVSILCTGDRELCHAFVRSPWAPRGARMDAFLASLETEPSPDDARILATLAIEDLADFITAAFDSEFSLVRYAESIATSERHFDRVEAALDRPMVREFLEPMLDSLWEELSSTGRPDGRVLFCISVPFPGCLVNALATARSIRRFFGDRAVVSMGGGYVNTELRNCSNGRLGAYIDILSFDRGFGGYGDLFRRENGITLPSSGTGAPAAALTAAAASALCGDGPERLFCPDDLAAWENRITASLVPDYSGMDFSLYPRLADDPNPMHRLWSDGAWLKAYLAHGCYWHRCSFCDVSLDYICRYLPVDVVALYSGLRRQALSLGVRGVHLVDEAAPPRALRDFARANLEAARADPDGGLIGFWGNLRFEKTFTRDLAEFLSAGGLVGVSGGIEIASPEGFRAVDKGIDLANLVSVCAAFKEAGVLVHSYLIYGYWDEDAQGVIDSAEVMRQLFAAALVDSAFWHKFVLTRHSRVYREWERGLHRGGAPASAALPSGALPSGALPSAGLQPVDRSGDFADNDLRFAGEDDSRRYTVPLDAALAAWMAGDDLDKPVRRWFPFAMPAPRIAADLVESYVGEYERKRDNERNRPFDGGAVYWWTGSVPVPSDSGELLWWHLGEEIRLELDPALAAVLSAALSVSPADSRTLGTLPRKVFRTLRQHGLCRISPL